CGGRALRVLLLSSPRPPTSPLSPYTTLFRSLPRRRRRPGQRADDQRQARRGERPAVGRLEHERHVGVDREEHAREQAARRHHGRSEEHTSELQSRENLVCRLLLEKKKKNRTK